MLETTSLWSKDTATYSALFDELFPICRSITGPGLRESLNILTRHIPLEIESVPTGTQVFDWTVPQEWAIEEAQLIAPDGELICDLQETNLCVVNYSVPVDKKLSLEELRQHLHSIPHSPTLRPYVTSYYRDAWGFCLPQRQVDDLKPGSYHARIKSAKYDGELNFGTAMLPGQSHREVLLTSYLCHPSLANNELSGPLVLAGLYDRISRWPSRKLTYRFVLCPETIGSLCVLHQYADVLKQNVEAGLVLTCLGGPKDKLSYKTTRRSDTTLDRLMASLGDVEIRPFTPIGGSDERQFCSPGFNLPVGQMARTVYGEYAEYHTSGDTKEFMDVGQIVRAVDEIERILRIHEYSGYFVNTMPYGEPQLGKRDLYPNMNSPTKWELSNDTVIDGRTLLNQTLYLLNYCDGLHSIVDISDKIGCSVSDLIPAIDRLIDSGLLERTKS